jgi:hypothetical protein
LQFGFCYGTTQATDDDIQFITIEFSKSQSGELNFGFGKQAGHQKLFAEFYLVEYLSIESRFRPATQADIT